MSIYFAVIALWIMAAALGIYSGMASNLRKLQRRMDTLVS